MTDRRISVAVVDSGVNVPHPHLPAVAGGVAFAVDGSTEEQYVDRLGHGTAATAAIYEKAPEAELWAVKVFHRELATTVAVLARSIVWAAERDMRLVNLSLGTQNAIRIPELEPAMEAAREHGTIVVSAFELDGRLWYPGSMDGVVGVVMDANQPRETVELVEARGRRVLRASPYPRPVPGVPPERNFNGISFAVANATGVLAALMADRPDIRDADAALDALG